VVRLDFPAARTSPFRAVPFVHPAGPAASVAWAVSVERAVSADPAASAASVGLEALVGRAASVDPGVWAVSEDPGALVDRAGQGE
jgi:hypothetical protein